MIRKRSISRVQHNDTALARHRSNVVTVKIEVEYRPTETLKFDLRNPRQHSPKQVQDIADSILEFGIVGAIVVDDEGQIVAGHALALAAKQIGLREVPVIVARHLSKAQLKAFRLAHNRLAYSSYWDERLLGESFKELWDLRPEFRLDITGFSSPEIDLAIQNLNVAEFDSDERLSEASSGAPVCRPGDIWHLRDHRILCGDATTRTSFELLMEGKKASVVFSDPPYNVKIEGHVSGKGRVVHREFAQASGEMSEQRFIRFLTNCLEWLANFSESGSIHFICMDWRHCGELLAAGRAVYTELKNICVWVKSNAGMGSLYRSQHEFVFVFKSGAARHTNNVALGKHGRNRTNIWNYAGANVRTGENLLELHPTAKPISLIMDALLDCSNRNEVVLDVFLGSGTTLLAAEKSGRVCYGIEIDPIYVDTAIRRWQNLTGEQAYLASEGKTFQKVQAKRGKTDAP